MRKISLVLLAAAFGVAAPFAVTHAQTKTVEGQATEAWAKIKGAWTQSKGAIRQEWGKLTDDDVQQVEGRREVLVGKLQTRYAISHEEAERQVGGFEKKYQ